MDQIEQQGKETKAKTEQNYSLQKVTLNIQLNLNENLFFALVLCKMR